MNEDNLFWRRHEDEPPADLKTSVHVWRASLDGASAKFGENVSPEERARADRFHQPVDRNRYVAGRSILRRVLAQCLGADDPSGRSLRIFQGPSGKPELVDHRNLHFNVSHCEGFALFAATGLGPVGVDIERHRDFRELSRVAQLVFTPAEREALKATPVAGRNALFFDLWTKKEALLKAMGVGIPALGDASAIALRQAEACWTIRPIPHLDGYAAAVALPRGASVLTLWAWPNTLDLRGGERRGRSRISSPRPALAGHRL